MFDKNKVTDVVLVHVNNRPEMLYPQIASFIDCQFGGADICGEKHAILFLVICDHENEYVNEMYKKNIRLIYTHIRRKELNDNVGVIFVNKKEQKKIIQSIEAKGLPCANLKAIFYDAHTGKLGGQRGIQNIAVLVAHYYLNGTKNFRNILMHRLDDDMFPVSMRYEQDGIYSIKTISSFFCRKRNSIKEKKARIVSSYYTIDTPSQIVDLFEAVEAIHTIVDKISQEDIRTNKFSWDGVSDKLYVYGVPKRIWVEESISEQVQDMLNAQYFLKTKKLSNILEQMKKILDLLAICVNRFEYNLANFTEEINWFIPRESLPGGCVTSYIWEEFAPGPNFGTHDVMWSCLEFNKRGGIYGDFPIGHIKTGSDRPLFVQNLISENDTGMRCDHAYAFHAIKRLKSVYNKGNYNLMTSEREFTDFGVFGNDIVEETRKRIIKIQQKMREIGNGNARQIYDFFDPIINNYDVINKRYAKKSIDEQEANYLTDKWLSSEETWLKIREGIR